MRLVKLDVEKRGAAPGSAQARWRFLLVPSCALAAILGERYRRRRSNVAQGLEQTTRLVLDFLAQWSDYRTEAEELEDLGEGNVLVVGRQRGRGKLSGAETDFSIFVVWKFRENDVIGVYLEGTRDAALQAAGLREWALLQDNVEIVRRAYAALGDALDEGAVLKLIEADLLDPEPNRGVGRGSSRAPRDAPR